MTDAPEFTLADLATYSGRPEASFTQFAEQALAQSLLLFSIASCLDEWPDKPVDFDLCRMAVLSMADQIFLSQPHAKAAASPFNSESIGSYSYSKTARAVSQGDATGVMWFDLAVERVGICDLDNDVPMSGGIEVFENDGMFAKVGRNRRLLSPVSLMELQKKLYSSTLTPIGGSDGFGSGLVEDPANPGYYIIDGEE